MNKKQKQNLFLFGSIIGLCFAILFTVSFVMPDKPTFSLTNAQDIDDIEGTNDDENKQDENIRPVYHGIVVIDPGHGGYDGGAESEDGKVIEKNVTLEMSLKIKKILEENNIQVVMTRDSDEVSWPSNNVKDLQKRLDIATAAKADLMVSIHCNVSDEDIYNVSGSEVYTNMDQKGSLSLAESIVNELDTLKPDLPSRGVKTAVFHLLTYNTLPTVIVETGFLSNPDDVEYLTNQTTQDLLVEAIANGIINEIKTDE